MMRRLDWTGARNVFRIFGDKSSLTLCKSPPPGLSLAWYVLQGADQTRLSVGQTFGSLSLIQRHIISVWREPRCLALTWKYLPASQNQIIYDLL